MAELPSGTVTFLLTDVEGSTALWEEAPETMRAALARHDALFEQAIREHGGVHIRPRGEGDSRFAVFVSAPGAVVAAVAIQWAFAAEPWPLSRSLRVRIGIHTGEAELRDGDYYGSAVNRCARLRGIGHGGQVLLSEATTALARDDLPPGASLLDMGPHRLKDLIRPERVFQVVVPGLQAEFPSLVSLDARLNNLPIQATALVGREREVAAARMRLLREDVRLLTLTGPGGTGKTRLGLQVAAEAIDQFVDGVVFVALAPISDPERVSSTIAQVLGVRDVGNRPVLESLKESLREKQILLLLDNFEQILKAAPIVSELLGAGPRVKILVTSRAALQVRGEYEFPVPPLTLPDPKHPPTVEALSQYGAVALFIERAAAIKPDFLVTNENAPAVAEICARLDGLPLAIELAAARIRLLSPEAILVRLGHGLALLTGGRRDLPARQQTLRGAIGWSYDLLSDAERRLFRQLGVFVGGFTLEAVEVVFDADGEPAGGADSALSEETEHSAGSDVLDLVGSLVENSLVRPEEALSGEPRFAMLETIREYALEQLEVSGETPVVRQRHRDYCLEFAERAMQAFKGREEQTWLNRLETEHDNLRSALDWCRRDSDGADVGLKIVGAVWPFWWAHGHLLEGERWFAVMLAAGVDAPSGTRANALLKAGYLAQNLSDLIRADAHFGESLELYRKLDDRSNIADALRGLGCVSDTRGEHERAAELFEESLTLSRNAGDDHGAAWSLLFLGVAVQHLGRYDRAEAILQDALHACQGVGREVAIARALVALGAVAHDLGDEARAITLSEEALALSERLGDRLASGSALTTLGWIAVRQDNGERAATCFAESLRLSQWSGALWSTAGALEGLSAVAVGQGRAIDAARCLGAVAVFRGATGARLPLSEHARHEQMVLAARTMIGETAYAAAWAEGRAMSLEQAVAYALERPTLT